MLFLQALMFYLPHIIYEMAEGKKVNIISKNIPNWSNVQRHVDFSIKKSI